MTKELIRNGGFERGNYDFWGSLLGIMEIQTTHKKYGVYASKLTIPAGAIATLYTKDYITVNPYALYRVALWAKNVDNVLHGFVAQTFDSDYQAIGGTGITILTKSGVFDWSKLTGYLIIDEEASYIRLADVMLGSEDDICYHDSISLLQIYNDEAIAHKEELVTLTNLTTKDTYYGSEFFTGVWKQAEYHLYCTSLTGTSPTLDVTIQGYDPNTEQWKDIMVFQQLDAAGGEFKTLLSNLGWKQRVKYVLAGTTVTDCDFNVGVVYKR